MAFWIKEISWKKVILSSVIFTIIVFVVRQIEALFTVNYKMPAYFIRPPVNFLITSLVFTFATGISLALIYYYLRDHLPKDNKQRIFYFADIMIGTSFIFFTLPVYLMFNVPLGLLISWFVSNFVILTTSSWILVKILK
jgi:hypothetical protein